MQYRRARESWWTLRPMNRETGCQQRKRGIMKEKGKREEGKSPSKTGLRSAVAALIASVAIFAAMLQTEKNILTRYEKESIYVAVKEIPKGQLISPENYQQYFQQRQLDKTCIPQTALRSPEQIAGLRAIYDIEPGVLLTSGMFQEQSEILTGMDRPVIAGFKADDICQVAGGVLRAGDRVNIYSVREEGTVLVWADVYVQQVFDAAGAMIGNEDGVSSAQRINVYLDEAEVETFYSELARGSLQVVKLVDGQR